MGKADLISKCKGCLKADPKANRCLAFTEPEYMWRSGRCWGYKLRLAVYLAGSVNGHDFWKVVTEWRLYAAGVLETAGYKVLNPVRGRRPTDTDSKDIVERDLRDIDQADILLVEMDHPERAYIGTAMEVRYAWERKKEIVLWGKANRESHWLQYHATAWFEDLDRALDHLRKRGTQNGGDHDRTERGSRRVAKGAARTRDGRSRVCGGRDI